MGPPAPDRPDELPDHVDEEAPRPLLGATFWVLIVFGVLCVLGGAGVALLAPRLFPPPAAAPAPPAAPPAPGQPSPGGR
ncbi:MAG: hypothetical protein GC203_01455 [Phenylobacterium sp.]|uniref:hypothetical protein n=1 Tax=Phenylobacterium sp. TaxID=1871053 RepID=UPI0025EA91F0|nr:hypothetical protein [Phenylobacterium sp.]MBI1196511.1 hypothetical protein [Phenylobacterium sp.]